MDEIFADLIPDYNNQIYKNYRLIEAPFEKIVNAIQQEPELKLRTRFLITDKLGRLFNAIPVAYDRDANVLFSLTFDPSYNEELFWWTPRSLDSSKYVSHQDLVINRRRKPKNKMVISDSLMKKTSITEGENGTDEVINLRKDPFGRYVFLASQRYPFGGVQNPKQGNVTVYDFYLSPSKANLSLMPTNMQVLYQRIIERSQIYPDDDNSDSEENTTSTLDEGIPLNETDTTNITLHGTTLTIEEDILEPSITGELNIDKLDQTFQDYLKEELVDGEIGSHENEEEHEQVDEVEQVEETESEQIEEIEPAEQMDEPEQEEEKLEREEENPEQEESEPEQVDEAEQMDEPEQEEEKPEQVEEKPEQVEEKPEQVEEKSEQEEEKPEQVEEKEEQVEEEKPEQVEEKEEQVEEEKEEQVEEKSEQEEEKPEQVEEKSEQEEEKEEQVEEEKEELEEPEQKEPVRKEKESERGEEPESEQEDPESKEKESKRKEFEEQRFFPNGIDAKNDNVQIDIEAEDTVTIPLDFRAHENNGDLALTEITNNTVATSLPEGIFTDGVHGHAQYLYYPTDNRQYRWLNDTSHFDITINNLEFPTLEHYYHYMKFLIGLEDPKNSELSKWGYEKILAEKKVHKVKILTNRDGELRSKMKNFSNRTWNKEKENILFYGRINKILQHSEIKEALQNTGDMYIMKKVKNVKNLPRDKLDEVLHSVVYFDKNEGKWYGGKEEDSWVILRRMLKENKLNPENIDKILG